MLISYKLFSTISDTKNINEVLSAAEYWQYPVRVQYFVVVNEVLSAA